MLLLGSNISVPTCLGQKQPVPERKGDGKACAVQEKEKYRTYIILSATWSHRFPSIGYWKVVKSIHQNSTECLGVYGNPDIVLIHVVHSFLFHPLAFHKSWFWYSFPVLWQRFTPHGLYLTIAVKCLVHRLAQREQLERSFLILIWSQHVSQKTGTTKIRLALVLQFY